MPPKPNRSRALAAGAVLAAAVVVFGLVKACAPAGSDIAARIDPLPDGEKRPEPVSFGDEPLWGERKLGMSEVAGIELRGDIAIVAGEAGVGDVARLAVVDVRTGEPHWVVDGGSPLRGGDGAAAHHGFGYRAEYLRGVTGKPLVYGDGDDWTVLVQYSEGSQGRETEIGVAALSGEDGTVRWKHALIRPRSGDKGDDDRRRKARLLAADARVVLTSVEEEQGIDPRTVALDPATGRTVWEHEGGWAYRFAGDLVLGETRGEQGPSTTWGQQPRNGADVFALDVNSGEKRWDLDKTFKSSHLDAVAGGTAVIDAREERPDRMYAVQRTVLVDTATGRVRSDVERVDGCGDDARTLIACAGSRGRLVTIRPGAQAKPVTTKKTPLEKEQTPRVRLIWQDRIFVTGSSGGDGPPRSAMIDRAANRLGPTPPGEVAAVSERAAAFFVPRPGSSADSPAGLAVYAAAVGAEPAGPSGPGEPALKPPRIDAAPLWTAAAGETRAPAQGQGRDTGLVSVKDIDLAGDALVYTGRDRKHRDFDKLVVADAETGEVRWSVREGASLGGGAEAVFVTDFHMVDVGGERLLLIPYSGSGSEEGFAGLSIEDGAVRWKKRVPAGDGTAILEAADGKVIAVEVTRTDGFEDVRDETIVYATGSRRELWRKRGVEPVGVGGGLVLAAKSGPGVGRTRKRLDLIAYGASDGERRWRLGDRYPEPELLHDEGGKTIVVGTADGGVVLDRATGRELARTYPPLTRCDGDRDALTVCEAGPDTDGSDPGGRAVTIRTRDGATEIRDLLETGFLTRYGAIGDWFVAVQPATKSRSGGSAERFLVLDGEGRRLSADLPGRPAEIDGGLAVLTPSTLTHGIFGPGFPSFTVHRVRG